MVLDAAKLHWDPCRTAKSEIDERLLTLEMGNSRFNHSCIYTHLKTSLPPMIREETHTYGRSIPT